MWYTGFLDLSVWSLLGVTLLLTHVTIIAVTVYLHRYSAHRALELHPALKHFFRFWLWLTTAMNTREWTAIHRKHHAKCETPEDPHSPVHKGLLTVLRKGAELYMAEAKNEETLRIYGKNCPDDWIERNLYTRFPNAGIVLMLALDLLLFGVIGLSVWAVQMLWIPLWAAGVVNGLGHALGYRNFERSEESRVGNHVTGVQTCALPIYLRQELPGRLDRAQPLHALSQRGHRADAGARSAAVRRHRPERLGRADALDSAVGRRRGQRPGPRAGLSQLRVPRCGHQPDALGHPDRR